MRSQEAQALGRLAGQAMARTVSHIEETHAAIARRAFGARAASSPVRTAHDAIAGGVYGGVRAAMRSAGTAAGAIAALLASSGSPIGSTPRANGALAALNAAIGDQLAVSYGDLAIPTTLRTGGRDVPTTAEALEETYLDASGTLAVFLHGLGETEDAWRFHADRLYGDNTVTYGSRLAGDLGLTPLYVRYNTGLHVSENGRRVADLLTDVVVAWPTTVKEIIIVGHSMGGLVARSACHYGEQTAAPWVPAVRQVFYLGSPHRGAPLERLASYVAWTLTRLGETRPWALLINGRSDGIKDLRFGYLLDDDWRSCHTDACLEDHRHDVPLLASADHYVISATITTHPDHPVGQLVGDLLVQPASAHGRHRRRRDTSFAVNGSEHLGQAHHLDLLNHPAVYDALRARLTD